MATQQVQSMVSETSICNQALSWVGAGQITSLDQPSRAAEWCRNNYAFLRDAVLEERMWTFAVDRATSTVADTPEWGEGLFAHPYPLEWLAVYRVYDDARGENGTRLEWVREGDNIITCAATVYMWGLKRVTDTGKFSQLFVQALAARMAADMAVPFTENRQLQADMWNLYQSKLEIAAVRDGQQGTHELIKSNSLVDVRNAGRVY